MHDLAACRDFPHAYGLVVSGREYPSIGREDWILISDDFAFRKRKLVRQQIDDGHGEQGEGGVW